MDVNQRMKNELIESIIHRYDLSDLDLDMLENIEIKFGDIKVVLSESDIKNYLSEKKGSNVDFGTVEICDREIKLLR